MKLVKKQDKVFVKFIESEFNVAKGGRTIKITTFENCRKMEGARQDDLEGFFDVIDDFPRD